MAVNQYWKKWWAKIQKWLALRHLALIVVLTLVPSFLWMMNRLTNELIGSRNLLEHTYQVLARIEHLRTDIDALELGRISYFVSHNIESLQQTNHARGLLGVEIEELKALTSNHYLHRKLNQFEHVAKALLEETARNIEGLDLGNTTYTAFSHQAQMLMLQARSLLEEMHRHENSLLSSRMDSSNSKELEWEHMLGLTGISLLLMLGFILIHMYREIVQHRRLEVTLREIQGQNQVTLRNQALMGELSSLLQACSSVDESLGVIRQFAMQLFNVDAGALYLFRESRNQLEERMSWGIGLKSEPVFQPESCWALRRGEIHVMNGQPESLTCRHVQVIEGVCCLCVPIIAQGNVLGVLYLENHHEQVFDDVQLKLASTVTNQVALTLASMKMQETLRNLSVRDPLTGLFNRRYMEESLQRELAIAQRKQRQLGVVILDLDHFKNFNDTFGHDAGDFLLREVGALLVSNSRSSDIVCRFGGEEFVLIFPETEAEIMMERTEHLRKVIFALQLQHFGRSLGQVSASFGLAFFPVHGSTADELLRLADKALYRAKAAGRNRLEMAARP
ncbi:diguanylate cyclase [Methylobacillus methanolivorans]